MNVTRSFYLKDNVQVHFSEINFITNRSEIRTATNCILVVPPNDVGSGAAIQHPNEPHDVRTGWRISLKRAVIAYCGYSSFFYKYLWSQIRTQLRWEDEGAASINVNKEQETPLNTFDEDETITLELEEVVEGFIVVDPRDGTEYVWTSLQ